MKKLFKAKDGSQFKVSKAQVYGERLEVIRKQRQDLKPEFVVADAKDVSSPLHEVFEWNDSKAANAHRLAQARHLINHIEVQVYREEELDTQPAYLSVVVTPATEETKEERSYVPLEDALTNEEYRSQVVASALKEIKYWKNRYKDIKEFTEIFEAIEKVEVFA